MPDLNHVAEVLEKAAAVLDAYESASARTRDEQRAAQISSLGAKYATATGEELPKDIAEKLASGDTSILRTVEAVIEKTAGVVESLGHGSPHPDGPSHPLTKSERAQAAWDRFGNFINS